MSTEIVVILASTPQGEIGYRNTIPWKLKGDLKRFKEKTLGNAVIMGRKTYESLPKPLEDRLVIVVTSDLEFHKKMKGHPPFYTARDLQGAINCANDLGHDRVYIAGGAKLYEEGLRIADEVELTLVYKQPEFLTQYLAESKERLEKAAHTPGVSSEALVKMMETISYLRPKCDAVIPNFNLKDFKEIPGLMHVVFDGDPDANGLPVLSHSYHTYHRKPK